MQTKIPETKTPVSEMYNTLQHSTELSLPQVELPPAVPVLAMGTWLDLGYCTSDPTPYNTPEKALEDDPGSWH